MNKRRILVVIFFLPLLLQCQSAPPQAMTSGGNTPAAGILRKARQILTNIKSTRYSHRTVVDEHSGVYVFDCSALVCHILEQAAPQALDVVTVDPGHKRARAKNFYDTFVNAPMGPPSKRLATNRAAGRCGTGGSDRLAERSASFQRKYRACGYRYGNTGDGCGRKRSRCCDGCRSQRPCRRLPSEKNRWRGVRDDVVPGHRRWQPGFVPMVKPKA